MTTIHTRQLQQYTQDSYNNTHKTTNNNTHKTATIIHTAKPTTIAHKTTTTIHTRQLKTIHTRQLQQYTQDNLQQYTQDSYNNTHGQTNNNYTQDNLKLVTIHARQIRIQHVQKYSLFCQILMRLESYRQFWEKKNSNTKFHGNPSSRSRVVPCGQMDGQRDVTKLNCRITQFCEKRPNPPPPKHKIVGTGSGCRLQSCKSDVNWVRSDVKICPKQPSDRSLQTTARFCSHILTIHTQPPGGTVRDRNPVGTRFSARPDWPCDPPSLLYNRYRVFPGGKVRPGRAADHSPPSSAAVMEQ